MIEGQLKLVFPDTRVYVVVEFRSSKTGRTWRHRVDAATADDVCREAEARWADVKAEVLT